MNERAEVEALDSPEEEEEEEEKNDESVKKTERQTKDSRLRPSKDLVVSVSASVRISLSTWRARQRVCGGMSFFRKRSKMPRSSSWLGSGT